MTVPGSLYTPTIRKTRASAYLLEQSLLFNDDDSAYLSRTPSSTGDTKTWTFSAWVKFDSGTNYNMLMGHRRDGAGTSTQTQVARSSSGALMFYNSLSGSIDANLSTEALFRDTSAWYHIVYIVDTTEATDTNRVKIIVNGTQQTIAAGADWPALNATTRFNEASRFMHVGAHVDAADNPYLFFGGSMAEVHFVDGTALAATNFGETDDDGFWNPIEYTGSYGTNGFELKFADTAAFGDDTSGNANDHTPNNFTASDQLEDTPTDSAADEIGNFATLNPLKIQTGGTLSEGNLKFSTAAGQTFSTLAIPASENFYMEATLTTQAGTKDYCGVQASSSAFASSPAALYAEDGTKNVNYAGWGAYGATFTSGDIIGVHVSSGTVTFYKNNATQGSATTGVTGLLEFTVSNQNASTVWDVNFGQKAFNYTPPSGAVGWATQNLPAPTIADGSQQFTPVIYTGTGSELAITSLDFTPDFVWIKNRDATDNHMLYDSVRGATKDLHSNTTDAETTTAQTLKSFDSAGFTLGTDVQVNTNTEDYVAWCWKAGGAASSNTDGSITTSVSANPTAGFSIISYTGNATAGATLGHGLSSAPKFIICKNRDNGANNWGGYHVSLGGTHRIFLDNNNAAQDDDGNWNDTNPTASVITLGNGGITNSNTDDFIMYAWAEVEGFSNFGSYTGNGSTDGPFIYTGFRPAFILIKHTNGADNWLLFDTKRDTYNVSGKFLIPNLTNAEGSGSIFDILSNGFKFRAVSSSYNGSGGEYIYAAYAENPFQGADGITQARAR